jgi:hypothetical protein
MTKARDISKLLSTANGKIAGANLDVSFENISDSGTAGTKVASGTTAQRGSTAGQIRFNTTTGLAEYYTGDGFIALDIAPIITSISPASLRQSLISSSPSIVITGVNFGSGVDVKIIGNDGTVYTPASTTRNSTTQITITAPNNLSASNEPYDVKVTSVSNLVAILVDSLAINDTPVFATASGSLGTLQDGNRSSTNLTSIVFTDEESTPTVSVTSGTLPTGITLNSNGTFSGTANAEVSDTTYSFTVTATDGVESATRNYSITVNSPLVLDYAVVAGGGSGGWGYVGAGSGGGGAGGMIYGSLSGASGVYSASIGGGGSQANGGNSSLTGNSLSVTCSGGGYGGWYNGAGGSSGGSGGGGGQHSGSGFSGTAGQGNSGGNAASLNGGGGGGKTQAGSVGNDGGGGSGGKGGDGHQWLDGNYYAGGGGGGNHNSYSTQSVAGLGGGGRGWTPSISATSGGANTGGGGGGSWNSGGSGVVILRVPTSKFSNTYTGSPTISSSGGYHFIKFTGNGTYTA